MISTGEKDLAPERQGRMRDAIRLRGAATVSALCRDFGISPATARRDLETLESDGRIRRVHGGAVSIESRIEEPLFDDKTAIAAREKVRIARAAARFVKSGDTLYLDGGSTVLQLARILAERTDITVITNSLRAAIELSGRGPRLILTGGQLRRLSQTMVGALTRPVLENINVDRAFMGTIGCSLEAGLTTTDPDEAFTKQEVIRRAAQVILLADGRKIGKVSFAKSGTLGDLDVLITDAKADRAFVRDIRKMDVEVVLA